MASTIKTTCESCKRIRYTLEEPVFTRCKKCRATEEFSQAKPAKCVVCSKTISKKAKSDKCRKCKPKHNRYIPYLDYYAKRKIRSKTNQFYPLEEVKYFVDNFELDLNRLQPNEYLLQMLSTLKYYEGTICIGYETMKGTPNEQLRKMYEKIYQYVYKDKLNKKSSL